jgi:hypothetical protein
LIHTVPARTLFAICMRLTNVSRPHRSCEPIRGVVHPLHRQADCGKNNDRCLGIAGVFTDLLALVNIRKPLSLSVVVARAMRLAPVHAAHRRFFVHCPMLCAGATRSRCEHKVK